MTSTLEERTKKETVRIRMPPGYGHPKNESQGIQRVAGSETNNGGQEHYPQTQAPLLPTQGVSPPAQSAPKIYSQAQIVVQPQLPTCTDYLIQLPYERSLSQDLNLPKDSFHLGLEHYLLERGILSHEYITQVTPAKLMPTIARRFLEQKVSFGVGIRIESTPTVKQHFEQYCTQNNARVLIQDENQKAGGIERLLPVGTIERPETLAERWDKLSEDVRFGASIGAILLSTPIASMLLVKLKEYLFDK